MDETQLRKALKDMNVPAADKNAKKRTLNLALAEFETAQKEKQKNPQGISFLSRLMGSSHQDQRRETMFGNKKLVYGGMATAMALILVTAVSMQDFRQAVGPTETDTTISAFSRSQIAGEAEPQSLAEEMMAENEVSRQIASVDKLANNKGGKTDRFRPEVAASREKKQENVMDRIARSDSVAAQGVTESNMVASPAINAPAKMAIMTDDENAPVYFKEVGRDKFEDFEENPIKLVSQEPVSTFSIDVDTSSYAFMRRQIAHGVLPQKDSVRIEEMINYFDYDYPLPESREQPFKPSVAVVPSPWKNGNKLVHIGIKGYDIAPDEKPRSNLVFLLDVSGSMNEPDKLPLLKNSMKLLLDTLSPNDTVGIVVYAGAAGTVLEPTKVSDKNTILQALDNLSAGGSTAGTEGIRQAYNLAESNFDKEAVNRVILATDGDFNVGITNSEELKDFIERKRDTGIFLSVLGFGQGNYNDHLMQELAQNGNGVAAYIDSLNEARKVLTEEASAALFPIAKDVKIQVEFNPAKVAEYRLVGYETRHLNREDFNNDAVDAGDIGAGHTVTAIYEITPVGGPVAIGENRYTAAKENCTTMRVHADPQNKNSPLIAKEVCETANESSGIIHRTKKACEEYAQTDCILIACSTEQCMQETGDHWISLRTRALLPDQKLSNEYAFLKIRYKLPNEDTSNLITTPITTDSDVTVMETVPEWLTQDTGWATAVASFGQLLKGGKYSGKMTYDDVITLAQQTKGADEYGYRAEFINLVRLAKSAAAMQKN